MKKSTVKILMIGSGLIIACICVWFAFVSFRNGDLLVGVGAVATLLLNLSILMTQLEAVEKKFKEKREK